MKPIICFALLLLMTLYACSDRDTVSFQEDELIIKKNWMKEFSDVSINREGLTFKGKNDNPLCGEVYINCWFKANDVEYELGWMTSIENEKPAIKFEWKKAELFYPYNSDINTCKKKCIDLLLSDQVRFISIRYRIFIKGESYSNLQKDYRKENRSDKDESCYFEQVFDLKGFFDPVHTHIAPYIYLNKPLFKKLTTYNLIQPTDSVYLMDRYQYGKHRKLPLSDEIFENIFQETEN